MPTIHNACARCCREHVTPSFDNVSFQTETNMPNKLEDNLCCAYNRASQLVLVVKNPPANAGDIGVAGLIPGLGRSPGGRHGNANILAWRMPWTEEPGRLQPMGPQSWIQLKLLSTQTCTYNKCSRKKQEEGSKRLIWSRGIRKNLGERTAWGLSDPDRLSPVKSEPDRSHSRPREQKLGGSG